MNKSTFFNKASVVALLLCFGLLFVVAAPNVARAADTSSSSGTTDSSTECSDPDTQKGIEDGNQASFISAVTGGLGVADSLLDAQRANPNSYKNSRPINQYCLEGIWYGFSALNKLVTGVNYFASLITAILDKILNAVCEYVATAINNVLASVCLPIPRFDFSLNLPQLQRKTCNGLSLLDFVKVTSGKPLDLSSKVSKYYGTNILTRWMSENGYSTASRRVRIF